MGDIRQWLADLVGERRVSRGTQAVIAAIIADPEDSAYASAQELARRAGVNAATVVRAAQLLGFTGWPDLSTEVRNRYLSSLTVERVYDLYSADDADPVGQTIGQDLRLLETMVTSLDTAAVRAASDVIRTSRRTVVFTTGTYAAPAQQLAHVGQMLGYDVMLQSGASTAMLNSARLLGEGDCFFTYSIWKTTSLVRELAEVAKQRGATVVAIADRRSAVAELADVFIAVPSEGRSFVPSITCAVSVSQSILRLLADADRAATRSRLRELDDLWERLGIVDDE
ncbi:MurR/RpiR family transcriptional regulator [Aeromicrobium phragmitis]|uniref:MurR/RpiR family transcriptional regulator n=1 Tax=Aeromicrobium phragmitis TaxID=2478914 RepID=A0A3L8PLP6_9ACTN|nr:MurR/RpiR family transcriptional regulator [Aeromicrobium phragmitis]RLV55739.1 MurR/RpiR family transcriptional regulator [Aeromicrobium phragmitis]